MAEQPLFGVSPDDELGHENDEQEQAGPEEDEGHPADASEDNETTEDENEDETESAPASEEPEPEAPARLLAGKYANAEELEKAHQEQQKLLGRQGQELGQLRTIMDRMAPYIQQMMQQQQQFPQQPQMQQAPQQQAQQQEDTPVDAGAWLDQFYERGPEAVKELLQRDLTQVEQRMVEQIQKQLSPIQQYVASQQAQQMSAAEQQKMQQNAAAFREKYPDWEQYREAMASVYDEMPELLQRPDTGYEQAYAIARARTENARMQQQRQQQQQTQQTQAKRGARMPQQGPRQVTDPNLDPADLIRQEVFGTAPRRKGVFG